MALLDVRNLVREDAENFLVALRQFDQGVRDHDHSRRQRERIRQVLGGGAKLQAVVESAAPHLARRGAKFLSLRRLKRSSRSMSS